eukprot:Selendium_serpulae@DN5883_c0_g1_i1.p1
MGPQRIIITGLLLAACALVRPAAGQRDEAIGETNDNRLNGEQLGNEQLGEEPVGVDEKDLMKKNGESSQEEDVDGGGRIPLHNGGGSQGRRRRGQTYVDEESGEHYKLKKRHHRKSRRSDGEDKEGRPGVRGRVAGWLKSWFGSSNTMKENENEEEEKMEKKFEGMGEGETQKEPLETNPNALMSMSRKMGHGRMNKGMTDDIDYDEKKNDDFDLNEIKKMLSRQSHKERFGDYDDEGSAYLRKRLPLTKPHFENLENVHEELKDVLTEYIRSTQSRRRPRRCDLEVQHTIQDLFGVAKMKVRQMRDGRSAIPESEKMEENLIEELRRISRVLHGHRNSLDDLECLGDVEDVSRLMGVIRKMRLSVNGLRFGERMGDDMLDDRRFGYHSGMDRKEKRDFFDESEIRDKLEKVTSGKKRRHNRNRDDDDESFDEMKMLNDKMEDEPIRERLPRHSHQSAEDEVENREKIVEEVMKQIPKSLIEGSNGRRHRGDRGSKDKFDMQNFLDSANAMSSSFQRLLEDETQAAQAVGRVVEGLWQGATDEMRRGSSLHVTEEQYQACNDQLKNIPAEFQRWAAHRQHMKELGARRPNRGLFRLVFHVLGSVAPSCAMTVPFTSLQKLRFVYKTLSSMGEPTPEERADGQPSRVEVLWGTAIAQYTGHTELIEKAQQAFMGGQFEEFGEVLGQIAVFFTRDLYEALTSLGPQAINAMVLKAETQGVEDMTMPIDEKMKKLEAEVMKNLSKEERLEAERLASALKDGRMGEFVCGEIGGLTTGFAEGALWKVGATTSDTELCVKALLKTERHLGSAFELFLSAPQPLLAAGPRLVEASVTATAEALPLCVGAIPEKKLDMLLDAKAILRGKLMHEREQHGELSGMRMIAEMSQMLGGAIHVGREIYDYVDSEMSPRLRVLAFPSAGRKLGVFTVELLTRVVQRVEVMGDDEKERPLISSFAVAPQGGAQVGHRLAGVVGGALMELGATDVMVKKCENSVKDSSKILMHIATENGLKAAREYMRDHLSDRLIATCLGREGHPVFSLDRMEELEMAFAAFAQEMRYSQHLALEGKLEEYVNEQEAFWKLLKMDFFKHRREFADHIDRLKEATAAGDATAMGELLGSELVGGMLRLGRLLRQKAVADKAAGLHVNMRRRDDDDEEANDGEEFEGKSKKHFLKKMEKIVREVPTDLVKMFVALMDGELRGFLEQGMGGTPESYNECAAEVGTLATTTAAIVANWQSG